MWRIIIRKFLCSALEGTQGYSGTVTKVCGIRLDIQELVFPANSYTFVWEQHHKTACYIATTIPIIKKLLVQYI